MPANRLAREKSPYLLQHAHNPVDWFPWGDEAFETARRLDRPLFLSVGYSACHWCHVMERESFENPDLAALLNDHFVSVKVDREERPDVDEIYMTATQMMTGHGGWPMSVFLLPDGRPFYGGTYFPPDNRGGRIGFRSLLTQLADAYATRRAEVETVAQNITDDLQAAARQRPVENPAHAPDVPALLAGAVDDLADRFDAPNGGFGGAPKFPPHHALRLLTDAARRGNPDAPRLLVTTLDKMALGGIYDHIGGGFHRYATDAVWLLPHFEKMLYDNAMLARIYAEAFDLTGRGAYARIARETCDWLLREMAETTPGGGGFHAALDADSEGEEGKYYVWTPAQIAAVLGPDDAAAFCHAYHILPGGNFHDEATGQPSGASIPFLAVSDHATPLPDALPEPLRASRDRLREARAGRIPPGKDDKVITAWNGLAVGALAVAGSALREPRYTVAAQAAARFCLDTLRRPDGTLLRRWAQGEAGIDGYLDDYAYLADGLLDLHDATGEPEWHEAARALADTLLARFWDSEDGGFFYAASDAPALIALSKDLFDGATPSPNGVAARVLVRLAARSPENQRFGDRAQQMLTAYRGVIERVPQGTPTLTGAALDLFDGDPAAPAAPATLHAPAPVTLAPGGEATLVWHLAIAPGFHVNSRLPGDAALVPTTARLASDAPASVGPVAFPPAQSWDDGAGNHLSVYAGSVAFAAPVRIAADAPPGNYAVTLTVHCQPCRETECLLPAQAAATATVTVRA